MMRALFLLPLMFSAPAFAQEAKPAAADAVVAAAETCVKSATEVAARMFCVGQAAQQCIQSAETPNTIAQSECAAAELDYWSRYLDTVFGELRTALGKDGDASGQSAALASAHEAWLGWRDAECAFAATRMNGGSGSGPVETGCLLQMTGSRAVAMETDLAGAKVQ